MSASARVKKSSARVMKKAGPQNFFPDKEGLDPL